MAFPKAPRRFLTSRCLPTQVDYRSWRDYDPEDAVRLYALRLRELGMIKSPPDKIIATGTDWRFIKEVRKELGI
jgi:NitT/TauT family transport system substrate-binding protein